MFCFCFCKLWGHIWCNMKGYSKSMWYMWYIMSYGLWRQESSIYGSSVFPMLKHRSNSSNSNICLNHSVHWGINQSSKLKNSAPSLLPRPPPPPSPPLFLGSPGSRGWSKSISVFYLTEIFLYCKSGKFFWYIWEHFCFYHLSNAVCEFCFIWLDMNKVSDLYSCVDRTS